MMSTKKAKRAPIPKEFRSLEEAGEFWDTHLAADYWDQMEDVNMEVDIQKRHFAVLLDDAIYRAARAQAKANDRLRHKVVLYAWDLPGY